MKKVEKPVLFHSSYVSSRLERTHPIILVIWCMAAAFITYFSMYAFRKPFTAARYEEFVFWGVGYKTILLFSQVGGYALSKFIGIKVISEMEPNRRAAMILGTIGIAHLALLAYAVAPYGLKPLFLFCNGLTLGMVFGCVFAFLEGRRSTEALAAGLCASFIIASGSVKTVGAVLMEDYGVSQFWMPFAAGALFWPSLLVGVWMLQQIPLPSALDVAARSKRSPFNGAERRRFFARYAGGFCLLILIMILLTVFRTVRDDYAAEIWTDFGAQKPAIFAQSETLVAFVVVALSAAAVWVRDNYRAFVVALSISSGCFLVALGTTVFYWKTAVWTERSAFLFMVLIGVSLYVPYVLFHTTIYERATAMLREKSNVGFLLYLGDSAGYLTTVFIMVTFDLALGRSLNFVELLFWLAVVVSPLSLAACMMVIVYFHWKRAGTGLELPAPREILPNASFETKGSAP